MLMSFANDDPEGQAREHHAVLPLPKNGSSLELRGPQANLIVMRPIDENRDDALSLAGIGSLFAAIAAVLLDYPMFATIFAFFSAFAVAVALRNQWEHRR